MGTETVLPLFRLHLVLYRVKLNNPLMGTETPIQILSIQPQNHRVVKLNNPLMGTETHRM